jgi:hypothetical protein
MNDFYSKQNLQLNILTFEPICPCVKFAFYKEASDACVTLQPHEVPFELLDVASVEKKSLPEKFYTDFSISTAGDFTVETDLTKSRHFALRYYRHVLREFLQNKGLIIKHNFVKDIEVWIPLPVQQKPALTSYHVFGLRIQTGRVSDYPELVVYYVSNSRILNSSVAGLPDVNTDLYKRVLFGKTIYWYNELPAEARYKLEQVFPVLNKRLEAEFAETLKPFKGNNYIRFNILLSEFLKEVLNDAALADRIRFHNNRFMVVPNASIHHTRLESNYIQLGLQNKVAVFTPKRTLKDFGPYKLPENMRIKFIMIFFEEDRLAANELYLYMINKKMGSNGKLIDDSKGASLYDFIRIPFTLDVPNSIVLSRKQNPLEELNLLLDKAIIDTTSNTYVAIYLSPYPKDEHDKEKKKLYYLMKEVLLNHHITSQVIYRDNIHKKEFRSYYMLNIASAILAKAGGIPWRLDREGHEELVIGVGAFKSVELGVQYIGSAFSFSNSGEFNEFDCFSRSEAWMLAPKIKLILQDYIRKNGHIKRMVIHFYKTMSKRELQPIKDALFQLGFPDLPIIILTINKTESSDYLAFDTHWEGLMPYSGTIIRIAYNEYLLFNNTRYMGTEHVNIESWHLPIKIKFQSTHPEQIADACLVKDLIDQVYQFSRMYYKSVKQQNLPVTLKYPEMVAEIFPWFKGENLPEFAKKNMWFL